MRTTKNGSAELCNNARMQLSAVRLKAFAIYTSVLEQIEMQVRELDEYLRPLEEEIKRILKSDKPLDAELLLCRDRLGETKEKLLRDCHQIEEMKQAVAC